MYRYMGCCRSKSCTVRGDLSLGSYPSQFNPPYDSKCLYPLWSTLRHSPFVIFFKDYHQMQFLNIYQILI